MGLMEVSIAIVWGFVLIGVLVCVYLQSRAEKKKIERRKERFRILHELSVREWREQHGRV